MLNMLEDTEIVALPPIGMKLVKVKEATSAGRIGRQR